MAKYPLFTVLSWAESLYQRLHGWQVDGGPGQPGPLLSRGFAQLFAASLIRDLAEHVGDARAAETLRKRGRDLLASGAASVARDPDGVGPPWFDPSGPFPWPPKKFGEHGSIFESLKPGAMDQVIVTLATRLADLSTGAARQPG